MAKQADLEPLPLDQPSPDFADGRRGYAPTLALYLGKRLLVYLLLTTLVLGIFAYLIDIVELMRQVSGKANVTTLQVMQMGLVKLPDMMLQMLPFAVLLATLIALQQLNRSQELVALRASGLPARRFLLGPLLMVLMCGLVALFVLNPLAATLLKSYERWRAEVFPGSTRGLVTAGGNIWLKQNEGGHDFFIFGRRVTAEGNELDGATVFVFGANGDFKARMDSQKMILDDGRWRLQKVFMLTPDQDVLWEPSIYLPTTLTPGMIRSSFNPPGTLSIWELRNFIKVLRETGFPSSQHEMTYQRLWALPALLVAMFLLAVPFALRYVRRGGLGLAVGAGLGLGFGFYLFSNLVAAFGLAGRLNVAVAAWTPTLIAALIATALLVQLREE